MKKARSEKLSPFLSVQKKRKKKSVKKLTKMGNILSRIRDR